MIAASPPRPRPAATLLVVRDGASGPEALLVRRARSAGFVPGTYVFPGGIVDPSDGSDAALERWDGLAPAEAQRRLGLKPSSVPAATAYFMAAVRETFEETGLLAGCKTGAPKRADGDRTTPAGMAESADAGRQGQPSAAGVRRGRAALLDGRRSFAEVLRDLDMRIDGRAFAYVAHWITPPSVPRRYDTRFFAVVAPSGALAAADERETTEVAWMSPARALELHAAGRISMIFPTVSTLQDCVGFASAAALVSHLRSRPAVAKAPASPLPEEREVLGELPGV